MSEKIGFSLLMVYPVAQHLFSFGGENGFRMKLHASHIECAVTECHNVSFFTYGGYFQAIREIFLVDYPGMVSSYLYGRGKSFEQIVRRSQTDGTLYAVEHLIQVGQFSSVHFADGLFAQADSQYRFLSGIPADDIQQQAGFFRNTGTGRQQNLVEFLQFF